MTIDRLIAFVKDHPNCDATIDFINPRRIVVIGEVVLPDGRVTWEHESIPATLQAARDWLGY